MAETTSETSHQAHSRTPYLIIFGLLFAFTVLEVMVALPSLGISRILKGSALVLLALTKAGMVALWFMHLKSEFKVLRWSVLLPFAFPALYAFVLIAEASWRLLELMALRRWVAAASLAAGLWAGQAAACPACAGRDNDHPNRTAWFLGAMILLPWTVSAAVVLTIRRLQRDSDQPAPAANTLHHDGDANEP